MRVRTHKNDRRSKTYTQQKNLLLVFKMFVNTGTKADLSQDHILVAHKPFI